MEKLNESASLALVKEAINSGALKLLGPQSSEEASRNRADMDAAYLLRLVQRLQGLQPVDK